VARPRRNGVEPNEPSTRRGTRNEARWDEILRAAAEEFNERGYRATRLQDIAARVGLLTGSLYYYIESKEDLLYALAESSLRLGLDATAEDELTAQADAATRLRAFIQRQMDALDSLQSPSGGIWRDIAWLSDEHRSQIESMQADLNTFVRRIIRQGMSDGDFAADVDVGLVSSTLFALLSTTRGWAKTRRRSYADIGDWYARMLLRGLASSEHLSLRSSSI
jgi:AcrR family transcriptional regulator